MSLSLPKLEIRLSRWTEASAREWQQRAEAFTRLTEGAGKSATLEAVKVRLAGLVKQGRLRELREQLGQRIAARAVTLLWLEDEYFRRRTLNPVMLGALVQSQGTVSTLTLHQLVDLYFLRFDQLDEGGGEGAVIGALEKTLRGQLQQWADRSHKREGPLAGIATQLDLVLGRDGPRKVVRRAESLGVELRPFLENQKLQKAAVGRFFEVCQAIYYIETLKRIPLGEKHRILKELRDPSVNSGPFDEERRIGHAALEVLIDRSGSEAPSDAWLHFVLDVAGDPRVVAGKQFVRWWKPLGEERIRRVRGWLSKVDIRVFLEALEDYAQSSAKDDIRRMLPARKQFVEGLSNAGWLKQSRLVLGSTIENAIRRRLGSVMDRIEFIRYAKPDTAVLILDCGDFFIVEGSHSFKIWVYLASPADNVLFDYSVRSLSHSQLINAIPAAYADQYPGVPFEGITHHPNLGWQYKVLKFLADQGIRLEPESVLTPQDYHAMLRKYPFPRPARTRTRVPEPRPLNRTVIRRR